MPDPTRPSVTRPVDEERFSRRARSIAVLLGGRLDDTMARYGLSERRLWASHRDLAAQHRRGSAPTLTQYWENVAHPQAQLFLAEMLDVIADEHDEFRRAFQQFAAETAERRRPTSRAIDGGHVRWEPPGTGTDRELPADIAIACAGIDEFVTAAAVGAHINEVGAWWQGRLRRRAILATSGRLLVTPVGRFELEVSAAELRLLRQPPWSHDDRLLSAFELAHTSLRDHVCDMRSELNRWTSALLEEAYGSHRRVEPPPHRQEPRTPPQPANETIDLA